MKHKVIVIDVESSAWKSLSDKPANEKSEIIEIGIAIVDMGKLKIIQNDSIIVKPQQSKISEFCTELTTLTQEQVDQGVQFAEAIDILSNKFDCKSCTFASWGDYDRTMFEENCKDFNIKYPFGKRHMNIKNTFAVFNNLKKEVGMPKALKMCNLELEGTLHRGNDDSKNIAKILIHMVSQYKIGQSANYDYDTYSDFVVCAESEEGDYGPLF